MLVNVSCYANKLLLLYDEVISYRLFIKCAVMPEVSVRFCSLYKYSMLTFRFTVTLQIL